MPERAASTSDSVYGTGAEPDTVSSTDPNGARSASATSAARGRTAATSQSPATMRRSGIGTTRDATNQPSGIRTSAPHVIDAVRRTNDPDGSAAAEREPEPSRVRCSGHSQYAGITARSSISGYDSRR